MITRDKANEIKTRERANLAGWRHIPVFLTLAVPVVGTAAAARLAMASAEATALICMFSYV